MNTNEFTNTPDHSTPAAIYEAPAHPDRAAVNRANAQKSTGPRTQEGKNRARLNAVRHGLSGRTVILPSDDLEAYNKFTTELIASLNPETAMERQLAQVVADSHWRLNRALSVEDAMLALGHSDHAGDVQTESDRIHTVLTAGIAYRENSQAFANLTIYEQRIHRIAERALKQLKDLQAERKNEYRSAMYDAIQLHKQHKMLNRPWNPAEDGFVYSRAQIEAESTRRTRQRHARIASDCDFDRNKYEQKIVRAAA